MAAGQNERTIIYSGRILSLQAARKNGNLLINQEVYNNDDNKGNNNSDHQQQIGNEQQFDNFFLTYSPTFHRYLVGRKSQRIGSYQSNGRPPVLDLSSPNVQILRSFLWYDEAVIYLRQLRRQIRNDDGIDDHHTKAENHFSEAANKPTWSYPMAAGTSVDGLLCSTSPPTSQGLSNPTNSKQNTGYADPIDDTLQVLASLTISHASFKAVAGSSSSSRTTIHNGRFSSSSSWSTETVHTTPPDDDTARSSASPTPTSSNDPLSSHEDHHDNSNSKSSNRINSNNDNKFLMDRMKEILKSHILDSRRWWVHPVRQDSHQREPQSPPIQMISSKRLIHHYQRVMDMLTRGRRQSAIRTSINDHPSLLYPPGLAMDQSTARQVLAKFPVVLLYDHVEWIQERINLLLAPLPPPGFLSSQEYQIAPDSGIDNGGGPCPRQRRRRRSSSHGDQDPQNMDWAMAYYQNGYGFGCTVEQATAAVVVLPQLLALNSLDASFGMVSVLYFYQQVPFHIMEQVRLELQDDLVGASPCNVAMMAWLHHVAHWSIPSCRALLQACSMIVLQCDIEPSWDVYENPKALVRRQLLGHVFEYLRHSLHLTPRHIKAMIKTHSRISTYSLTKVQSILAFLKQYGFQSADLQTIILRMPSVLGMSIESAERHMNFFNHDVGWTEEQLCQAILKQPSLLQYSIESNLRPKLAFFKNDLQISKSAKLSKMLSTCPSILGRSLEQHLRPTATLITKWLLETKEASDGIGNVEKSLDLTIWGEMVQGAPELLLLNWKSNLEPTLDLLSTRLRLSRKQVLSLALSTPRTLTQSIERSLIPKLSMMENAVLSWTRSQGDTSIVDGVSTTALVMQNPSLLLAPTSSLERRLAESVPVIKPTEYDISVKRIKRSTTPSLRRRQRLVNEIDPSTGEVCDEFQSVAQAAAKAGVSVTHLYRMLRDERLSKNGHKFVFNDILNSEVPTAQSAAKGDVAEARSVGLSMATDISRKMKVKPQQQQLFHEFAHIGLTEALKSCFYPLPRDGLSNILSVASSGPNISGTEMKPAPQLTLFVSGRAYPPENKKQVRGQRRAGGLSIYLPQVYYYFWSTCPTGTGGFALAAKLQQAATTCLEQTLYFDTGLETTTSFADGTILLAYPYLRPSKNRCSLYVCRDALRLISELISQDKKKHKQMKPLHVFVYTDSTYAWRLLHNETQLMSWGSLSTREGFLESFRNQEVYGGLEQANPDILYPLCGTYCRLVTEESVKVSFRHVSETYSWDGQRDTRITKMPQLAMQAAAIQYDRALRS